MGACKIYEETGEVPLDCLFQCKHPDTCKSREPDPNVRAHGPKCKHCGSTEVRWRQQNGKWVLFSNEPGKIHTCKPNYQL